MNQPTPPDTITAMIHPRRRSTPVALVVAAITLAAACGTTRPTEPAPAATDPTTTAAGEAGWAAHPTRCNGDLPLLEAHQPHRVTAAELTAGGCTPTDTDRSSPWGDHGDARSWWVAPTGEDRLEVTATIDTTDETPDGHVHVTVTHHTPGDGCAATEEWRGALVTVIEGPADGPAPTVEHHTETTPCD